MVPTSRGLKAVAVLPPFCCSPSHPPPLFSFSLPPSRLLSFAPPLSIVLLYPPALLPPPPPPASSMPQATQALRDLSLLHHAAALDAMSGVAVVRPPVTATPTATPTAPTDLYSEPVVHLAPGSTAAAANCRAVQQATGELTNARGRVCRGEGLSGSGGQGRGSGQGRGVGRGPILSADYIHAVKHLPSS